MRPLYFVLLHLIHTLHTSAEIQSTLLHLRNPTINNLPISSAPSVAQILGQNNACQLLGQALEICNSLTPGFPTLQPSLQAQCLCYSSTVYAPGIFDGAVRFCANYASTAAPEAYGPLTDLNNFCGNLASMDGPNSAAATVTSLGVDVGPGSSSIPQYKPTIIFPTTFSLVALSASVDASGSGSVSAWTRGSGVSTSGAESSSCSTSADIFDLTTTTTFEVTITINPTVATQASTGYGNMESRRLTTGEAIVFSLGITTFLLFL